MKNLIAVIASAASIFCFLGVTHAAEKHLFYIHGCCIDKTGSGAYTTIAKDLQGAGFNVVFDVRYDDSTAAIQAYSTKVAGQVKDLLAKGVAPEDITVSGFSLGSVTAMFASIEIANPKVNYVLLAGCPGKGARTFDIDYAKVQGRILSIVDVKDDRFESCKSRLPESALKKELEIDSGYGHVIFRYTNDKAYKLWKEPLEAWAKGQ